MWLIGFSHSQNIFTNTSVRISSLQYAWTEELNRDHFDSLINTVGTVRKKNLYAGELWGKKNTTFQIITLNSTLAHAAVKYSVATAAAQTAKNTEASISMQIKIELKMLSLNLIQKLIPNKSVLGIG